MTKHAHGQCYCGKITFTVALPVNWFGLCSCTQCQKIHGSAFATWAGFKTKDFTITDPEKNFAVYNTGRADRGFCKHCGTSFYFKYTDPAYIEKNGEWVFFTPKNMGDLPPVKLDKHVFFDEMPDWMESYDTTPRAGGSGLDQT